MNVDCFSISRKIHFKKIVIVWFILLNSLSSGCAVFISWNDVEKAHQGYHETVYTGYFGEPDGIAILNDGLKMYEYWKTQSDPSCYYLLLIDEEGMIVGLHYRGYCGSAI